MSKKPVPSKKQAPSSTGSRHSAYVRRARVNMTNQLVLDVCSNCGVKKRRHFACGECGFYGERQVKNVSGSTAPSQEIEA